MIYCFTWSPWELTYDDEIDLGNMPLSRITSIDCDEKNGVCFDVESLDLYSVLEPIPLGEIPFGLMYYSDGVNTYLMTAPPSYQYEANLCLPYTSPLPVELVSFFGHGGVGNNTITWETASELNSDYFKLEYSLSGLDWDEVDEIKAQGNSQTNHIYTLNHKTNEALIYYRLLQVDFDGTQEMFGPISVLKTPNKIIYYDMLGREVNNPKGLVIEWDGKTAKKVYK